MQISNGKHKSEPRRRRLLLFIVLSASRYFFNSFYSVIAIIFFGSFWCSVDFRFVDQSAVEIDFMVTLDVIRSHGRECSAIEINQQKCQRALLLIKHRMKEIIIIPF